MFSRSLVCAASLVGAQVHAQSTNVTSKSEPAAMLASFDTQSLTVPVKVVATYQRALNRVVRNCQEPETSVATYASNGVDLVLREKGVEVTHLAFLSAMDEAMPGTRSSTGVACSEIAASLVLMIGE